jgi:hypothetical protein
VRTGEEGAGLEEGGGDLHRRRSTGTP